MSDWANDDIGTATRYLELAKTLVYRAENFRLAEIRAQRGQNAF